MLKDLSYARRGLRRSPAFASVVVLTVALTIAANAVVFSVVEHVLLDPLPYPDGNRIVRLGWVPEADPLFVQFGIGADLVRRLGARDVVGRVVDVNGTPRTIIGVTPAQLGVPMSPHYGPPDVWLSLGFDPTGLASVELQLERQPAPADRAALEQTLIRAFGTIPGVSGVAFGTGIAMMEVRPGPFAIEGPAGPQVISLPVVDMPTVTPDYFRVMRIPLLRGRTFDGANPVAASHELIVNQSVARRFWPDGNALGARLRVGAGADAQWLTVVGIAGDVHLPGSDGDIFVLQMYRPTSAQPTLGSSMVLRVNGTGALEPKLKQALERAGVPAKLDRVVMTESLIDNRVLARPRFALATFGAFALLALAVSAAGLYGLIAYAVTQRTREIGVRIALGAEPSNIARLVLVDSVRLLAVGGCLGLLGAWAGTRLLGGFLYQVRPTDPAALGGAALLMVVVALIATLVPVRRALRINPVDALRSD